MSCHDGSISVFHVINTPNGRTAPIQHDQSNNPNTTIVDFFGNPGARIGGEFGDNSAETGFLTDDHPISFSYTAVEGSPEYQLGAKANKLHTLNDATINGVRFFGPTNRVECSSCHDPHVNYIDNPEYTPFLITSNSGSALCLACHQK
jgi:predicted CXXCH cytochrome family protein